jgi:hypothetical protein
VNFFVPKSLLASAVTLLLAIGFCLPCQKLFGNEPSQKSCCNSKGECKRPVPDAPVKKSCNLQVSSVQPEPPQPSDRLMNGNQADAGASIAEPAQISSSVLHIAATPHIDSSPPGFFSLNPVLLI